VKLHMNLLFLIPRITIPMITTTEYVGPWTNLYSVMYICTTTFPPFRLPPIFLNSICTTTCIFVSHVYLYHYVYSYHYVYLYYYISAFHLPRFLCCLPLVFFSAPKNRINSESGTGARAATDSRYL
jgi:hypothetical protein